MNSVMTLVTTNCSILFHFHRIKKDYYARTMGISIVSSSPVLDYIVYLNVLKLKLTQENRLRKYRTVVVVFKK